MQTETERLANREVARRIMDYGDFDRMPVIHWAGWPETRERWVSEGMPSDVEELEYFNAIPHLAFIETNLELYPAFEEETLEETDEYRVFIAGDGVTQKTWKHRQSIPHYLDYVLKDARGWDEYKKRLQPDPGRIPDDLDARIAAAESSEGLVALATASLMGWVRNWMGVENMSFLIYDSPDVYADMVDTLADLTCWTIDQVLPRMKRPPDLGFGWEDICGSSGPLVGPTTFNRYVAPGYIKIRNKLEEHGVKLLGIDSDGDIAMLAKPWLDAGVNLFLPIEIGVWKADPTAYRRQYGREMRIIGGFNKLELEKGPEAIDAEIESLVGLMRDGGYLIMPDHIITPGTSLENYRYYLERVRSLRL